MITSTAGRDRIGLVVIDGPGWPWGDQIAGDNTVEILLGGVHGVVVVIDPSDPSTYSTAARVAAAAVASRPQNDPVAVDGAQARTSIASVPFLAVCWSKVDILPTDANSIRVCASAERAVRDAILSVEAYARE